MVVIACNPALDLTPVPNDCTRFFRCASGVLYVFTCGPGTWFNNNLKVCDYPYNVVCPTTLVGQLYPVAKDEVILASNKPILTTTSITTTTDTPTTKKSTKRFSTTSTKLIPKVSATPKLTTKLETTRFSPFPFATRFTIPIFTISSTFSSSRVTTTTFPSTTRFLAPITPRAQSKSSLKSILDW